MAPRTKRYILHRSKSTQRLCHHDGTLDETLASTSSVHLLPSTKCPFLIIDLVDSCRVLLLSHVHWLFLQQAIVRIALHHKEQLLVCSQAAPHELPPASSHNGSCHCCQARLPTCLF
eukprot:6475068-Amphidinium_carterae.1